MASAPTRERPKMWPLLDDEIRESLNTKPKTLHTRFIEVGFLNTQLSSNYSVHVRSRYWELLSFSLQMSSQRQFSKEYPPVCLSST